ncbi:putative rhamnosyl transferase [Corynebacterium afermentans]|uniref:glycosyltransferase n=1 Tax=Corynebacterium afermentans TaxID=38286 RepID=UPI002573AB89|nr:glycosyltransferase [Corynebacterium afermentans]MCG7292284.1 putative rhamnosyl transferase [Corynebacterium afermentans]
MDSAFLGHTRFSLYDPTSPSWRLSRQAGKQNRRSYERELYSPSRMRNRMAIFFDHSLPILENASGNHKIFHVVSYSQELPDSYAVHLRNAADRFPWLHLDRRTPENRKGLSLDDFARKSFSHGDIYAEFRLDDDDVLASTYFDALSEYVAPHFVGKYVSLGLGIQAYFDGSNFHEPRLEHRPKIAIGLARICTLDSGGRLIGPPRAPHTQSDRRAPVIVDSRAVQFLHTLHLDQDSGVDKPEGDLGNRFRNYLRQPKPDGELKESLFPGIRFREWDDSDQLRAVLGAHANFSSVWSLAQKARQYFKRPSI